MTLAWPKHHPQPRRNGPRRASARHRRWPRPP